MAMSLTPAQARLLRFIQRYQDENEGVSPSYREMSEEMGCVISGVHRMLVALQERGRIVRPFHRARCIEIIPVSALANIPTHVLIAELNRRTANELKAA